MLHTRIVYTRRNPVSGATARRATERLIVRMAKGWFAEAATTSRLGPVSVRWADNGRTLVYDRDLLPKT